MAARISRTEKPVPVPRLKTPPAMSLHQQLQRQQMRRRKIGDVDIVADRGAVRRVVIVAEYREIRDVALQRHHRARNEMGFVVAQFADPARRHRRRWH